MSEREREDKERQQERTRERERDTNTNTQTEEERDTTRRREPLFSTANLRACSGHGGALQGCLMRPETAGYSHSRVAPLQAGPLTPGAACPPSLQLQHCFFSLSHAQSLFPSFFSLSLSVSLRLCLSTCPTTAPRDVRLFLRLPLCVMAVGGVEEEHRGERGDPPLPIPFVESPLSLFCFCLAFECARRVAVTPQAHFFARLSCHAHAQNAADAKPRRAKETETENPKERQGKESKRLASSFDLASPFLVSLSLLPFPLPTHSDTQFLSLAETVRKSAQTETASLCLSLLPFLK